MSERGTVRMGSGRSAPGPRWGIAILFGVVLAAAVVGICAFLLSGEEEEEVVVERVGCESDADCKPGSICARRGCVILLSSEHPGIWHDDLRAQVDAGPSWKPRPSFGEKLKDATKCPAPTGEVTEPEEDRVIPLVVAHLYEISGDGIRVYQQKRIQGKIWQDSIRFWFPPFVAADPSSVCISNDADRASLGKGSRRGRTAQHVDVALKQAVPAGTMTGAAVSCETRLPPVGQDGFRILELELDPVVDAECKAHTVVALPLGSDVTSIEGPPPTTQRLLPGFVVYYWDHGSEANEVALRFRVPEVTLRELDVGDVNP